MTDKEPTQEEIKPDEERGLYNKYIIKRTDGKPLSPSFYAIVLRIDGGRYVDACRVGALAFASAIRPYNEHLSHDIYRKVYDLIGEEVVKKLQSKPFRN